MADMDEVNKRMLEKEHDEIINDKPWHYKENKVTKEKMIETKLNLYLVEGYGRKNHTPKSGPNKTCLEYSDKYIVLCETIDDSKRKLLNYLTKEFKNSYWTNFSSIELKKGADISLEKRIEVLSEVYKIIE
jgi:hypothetical protein